MRKAQHAILLALAIAMGPVAAQDDPNWFHIVENKAGTRVYSAKKGSFELTHNKGGDPIAVVVGRIHYKQDNKIDYYHWYVKTKDCDQGMGKMVTLTVDKEFFIEGDFVRAGGSINAAVADFICNVRDYMNKQQSNKGL